MASINIPLNKGWSLRRENESESIPARVPGSVYSDYIRAGILADPYFKDNEDSALSFIDNDFVYECTFETDNELLTQEYIDLVFYGIDTVADIYLNNQKLLSTTDMHRTYRIDIKKLLRENSENNLKVHIHSPLRFINEALEKSPVKGAIESTPGFSHLRKSHYMFGWDWGAHLPDAGLWKDVAIEAFSTARIDSVLILQNHQKEKVELKICPEIIGSLNLDDLEIETTVKKDNCFLTKGKDTVSIDNPELWWPNGYGTQPLYDVEIAIIKDGKTLDTWERKIGLRTVTVSRDKDQWGEEFALTVNDTKIFAMGADYIPEDHILARRTKERTRDLIKKAVFANYNCIRIWGGGHYPDDEFYNACDESGILVWQDFMFACAAYDLTDEMKENIVGECVDNIKRLRHHASLGLFCGNNELEFFTKEGTWISKDSEINDYLTIFEDIIPKLVKEFSPQTYYWPSSPSSGGNFDDPGSENRGDQHYWDVWHGNKPFSEYRKFYFRFASEFGFQSFPCEKTIDTITDEDSDKNIFSYIMERHQRNGEANGKIMNYMQKTFLCPGSFSQQLYASQLLQAEAIKYGVEHFRRNRGRCMGTIVWQFNDCWPVASWSSIDYTGRLKALHYYEKRAFAPIMISAMEQGMINSGRMLNEIPGDFEKSVTLAVSNESTKDENLTVLAEIRNASGAIQKTYKFEVYVKALSTFWLEKIDLSSINIFEEYLSFECQKEGKTVSSGTVILSLPKYFKYQKPNLKIRVSEGKITVSSQAYAKSVEIQNENEDLILSDNYFDMNPGEKTLDVISGDLIGLKAKSVYDIGRSN